MVSQATIVLIFSFTVTAVALVFSISTLDQSLFKYGKNVAEPILTKGLVSISYSSIIYHGGVFDQISPQDPLSARFIFVNNYIAPVDVRPHLQLTGGDGHKDMKDLIDNSCVVATTCPKEFNFTAGSEGRNTAVFVLDIYNHTTNTFLGQQNATADFPVVSYADKLHALANWYTLLGIIIAAVIGIATVVALFRTEKRASEHTTQLKEQNVILREQASIQNRPWISLGDSDSIFHVSTNVLQINLKNYGKTVATDIVTKVYAMDGTLTIEELKQKGKELPSSSMAPTEIWFEDIPITPELYNKMETSSDCHFGLFIQYGYENSKKGSTIIIGKITKGRTELDLEIKQMH